MIRAILDTNILIPHIDGREKIPLGMLPTCGISSLVVFELLRLPGISDDEQRKIADVLLLCKIVPLDRTTAELAAMLNRSRPRKHHMDLLIAATAMEAGVPLISKNVKDFKNIPNLLVRSTL